MTISLAGKVIAITGASRGIGEATAEAVARAIAFAIEQPHDVEIGDITIHPSDRPGLTPSTIRTRL